MVRVWVCFEDTALEFVYELGVECEGKRNQGWLSNWKDGVADS